MATQFRFPNVVYVTLKKFNENRRKDVIRSLFTSTALKNGKIMAMDNGFVVTYEIAKNFVRYLHLHTSRFFSLNEATDLYINGLISEADLGMEMPG